MSSLQFAAFAFVLLLTSVIDIFTHRVYRITHILMLLVALLNFSRLSLSGAVICFLPIFVVSIATRGKIGGGDVKVVFECGLLLGAVLGLLGMLAGFALAGIVMGLHHLIMKRSAAAEFALVPFLSVGFLGVTALTVNWSELLTIAQGLNR